ncbi:MAG TPA: hypothetical protein VLH10_21940 [Yinghuangia sp.]|nr:hypothetical protein [Yinghuangia sp.]
MSDTAPMPVHLGKVLEGLAGNPALPAELVRRFFAYRKGSGDVANRPDLTSDMIGEIIATDYHWLTHSLALNRGLPHTFRMQLAEHRDPAVRAALVIGAENAPRELFERLIGDSDLRVREYLAQSKDMPADLRARLADDPDPRIRATLAQWWEHAPEPVRRRLLTDAADEVRAAACSTYYRFLPHPVPPADLLPALLADPVTRAGAVRHMALDSDTAHRLAADRDYVVRVELAQHPDLPPQLRDLLADDPSTLVALRIFARQDTPEAIRDAIHTRIMADARPLTEPGVYDDLDDDALELQITNDLARMQLGTLSLAWVTADPLPHVDSPYVCFRASAAMSESLPADVVTRLLDDEESHVRTTMALHARDRIDPATAERIDRGYRPFKGSRWRPADDFPLPPQVLRRLATDPDPKMRLLAPRDPDLPAELAGCLATDPNPDVRRAVASHPRLPTHHLAALLADPTDWVATAAASNPNLPLDHMHRLLTLADL